MLRVFVQLALLYIQFSNAGCLRPIRESRKANKQLRDLQQRLRECRTERENLKNSLKELNLPCHIHNIKNELPKLRQRMNNMSLQTDKTFYSSKSSIRMGNFAPTRCNFPSKPKLKVRTREKENFTKLRIETVHLTLEKIKDEDERGLKLDFESERDFLATERFIESWELVSKNLQVANDYEHKIAIFDEEIWELEEQISLLNKI